MLPGMQLSTTLASVLSARNQRCLLLTTGTQWFRDGWPSLTSGGGFMCPGQICEQHLSCVRVCGRIGPHAYLWNRLPKAPRLLGSCEVEDVSRTAECAEVAKGDAPWLPSLEPEERFDEEFIGSASLCPPSTIRSF